MNITSLENSIIDTTTKGIPNKAIGSKLGSLGEFNFNLLNSDLPFPVAVINSTQLNHNLKWMADFSSDLGISLCPHGKTTMAPQLFKKQLEHGAWGMTAATACHVRTYRQFGVNRIIMANQLIGEENINLILDELTKDETFDFYCLVDSIAGLEILTEALKQRQLNRPLQVLLEIGTPGGRNGVRNEEQAIVLGRAIKQAAPYIELRGVEAFEGVIHGEDSASEVTNFVNRVVKAAQIGTEEGWFADKEIIVSAGGTVFFDLVAKVLASLPDNLPARPVLRSGCYITHDSLYFSQQQALMQQRSADLLSNKGGLVNALEVWAQVQSVPESRRAICSLGKRDVSHDIGLPQPLKWFRPSLHQSVQDITGGVRVAELNDQHAYVDFDEDCTWQVGDLVCLGVAHPCTTFDKWGMLFEVDDQYQVIQGIKTFF